MEREPGVGEVVADDDLGAEPRTERALHAQDEARALVLGHGAEHGHLGAGEDEVGPRARHGAGRLGGRGPEGHEGDERGEEARAHGAPTVPPLPRTVRRSSPRLALALEPAPRSRTSASGRAPLDPAPVEIALKPP